MVKMPSAKLLQKATYLRSQLSLVRNVQGANFSSHLKPKTAKALGERLTERIIDILHADDLTDDQALEEIGETRYGLLPKQSRGPGYHLLHIPIKTGSLRADVWCEVMCFNHLTFSITGSYFDFKKALRVLQAVVDRMGKPLNYVYHERYGYVSAQLTLMGTGLRIRSWMHLGALAHYNYQHELSNAAALRGVYIEMPSQEIPPPGNRFIFFNRFSMGATAETIVTQYQTFLQEVIHQEGLALMRFYHDEPYLFLDMLIRAQTTLKNALLISEQEALDLISDIRLGITAGAITPKLGVSVENFFDAFWFDAFHSEAFYSLLGHHLERENALPHDIHDVPEWRDSALRADALQSLIDFKISRTLMKKAFQK